MLKGFTGFKGILRHLQGFKVIKRDLIGFKVILMDFKDYISKGPGSKGPGSKRPAQRVPKKRVPQQLWHIFSPSRTIFKASRMGHFECTQVQNVHNSIYSYGGMGPYEMYTNMAAQDWGGGTLTTIKL